MTQQQQLLMPDSLCGSLIDALYGLNMNGTRHDERRTAIERRRGREAVRTIEVFDHAVNILDDVIPLQGASHADVIAYSVEIPMRYAECFALLSDRRKVPLADARKFVGWSSHDPRRSLLFRDNDSLLELKVDNCRGGHAPGNIRDITLQSATAPRAANESRFIGIDGDLIILPTAS